MQKIVNFRAFLFVFIGAIIGIVFSFFTIEKNIFVLVFAGVVTIFLCIFLFATNFIKKVNKFAFVNKFLFCILIGIILFFSLSLINYKTYNNGIENNVNSQVTARICNLNEKSSYNYVILENVSLKNLETNKTRKLNGKVSLVIYSEDVLNLKVSDEIIFNGLLIDAKFIKDGEINTYNYKNNIKYTCFINADSLGKSEGKQHFDEQVREKIKNILFDNLSYNNASIAYASIFGDKTLLDDNIYSSFSLSGTAHLLCVSGLHVGFLVATLYGLLSIFKVKRKYTFIVLSLFLFLYTYLCGFSPSVVRASIMSIILLGSRCFGNYRYDNLSSLSLAGLIILFAKPFMLFDVGFQLSFASCFGIFLLMPIFNKFFKRIKFYNKFTQAFSLTLAAQIGTFPIILHNFEKLSFLSIVANMVVVPLFSILFIMLFTIIIFNLVFPFNFLFKIIEIGLNFIVIITKGIGAISDCVYYSNGSKIFSDIIFYTAIILISRFINLQNKVKVVSMLICAVIISLAFISDFLPKYYDVATIINTNIDGVTIITNSNNEKILVSTNNFDLNDYFTIKKDLQTNKILKINAVILSNYDENMQQALSNLCNNYNVENLYLADDISDVTEKYLFKNLNNTKIIKANEDYLSFSSFTFKIIKEINSIELNLLDNAGSYSLFFIGNFNKAVSLYLLTYNKVGEYVKTNYVNEKYLESLQGYKNIICKNSNINQANIFKISKINDTIKIGEKIKYAV